MKKLVPKVGKNSISGQNHEVVPVPLNRTYLVPVPRQVVPVPTCRMCLVPVPNIVVPVPQCLKAQIFVVSHS